MQAFFDGQMDTLKTQFAYGFYRQITC